MKRIISVLLTITMMLCITSSIPLSVSAAKTDKVEGNMTYTDQYGEWNYKLTGFGDGYIITDYTSGDITDIEIPASINNIPVLEIGEGAFRDCISLTNITLPNGVTTIGDYAFCSCISLTGITIPDSVKTIGYGAFWNCSSLTRIIIPNGVTAIAGNLFLNCSMLEDILIPNSVKTIGNCAFSGTGLYSITIPDSVVTIGIGAFDGCWSLCSVLIPDSVTTIGEYVFKSCSNLCEINVSSNNQNYSSVDGVLFDKTQSKLICCPAVRGSGGFYRFNYIIPNSVTTIANAAYYDCIRLNNITIPDSVTTIGYAAFWDCRKLEDIYYGGTKSQWNCDVAISSGNDYLKNANIHFKEYLVGDLSGDDVISIKDVLYLMKYLIGDIELTDSQIICADANNNGELTLADAVMIQKAVLGINKFV